MEKCKKTIPQIADMNLFYTLKEKPVSITERHPVESSKGKILSQSIRRLSWQPYSVDDF